MTRVTPMVIANTIAALACALHPVASMLGLLPWSGWRGIFWLDHQTAPARWPRKTQGRKVE